MSLLFPLAVLAALLGCGVLSSALAQGTVVRSIRVVTDPIANICEVIDARLACIARSPAQVELEFRNADSAKRLHLVRIGYETARLLVRPQDSEVRATLRARPIAVQASTAGVPGMDRTRTFVHSRIRELFFGEMPPDGLSGFDFLGDLEVGATAPGKFEVIVPVIIDDQFRVKHLAQIDRSFSAEERPWHIARALWETQIGALAAALRKAFSSAEQIEAVTVAANYSRTRYVLVDEDSTFQMSTKAWVGSRTTGYGSQVQRIDEFRVSTFRLPTGLQQLTATKKIYVAVFIVPTEKASNLAAVSVLSNDNRSGQLVSVKQP